MEKPIQQKQKAGIVTSLNDTTLTKVTYGKYATRVPDEVAYGRAANNGQQVAGHDDRPNIFYPGQTPILAGQIMNTNNFFCLRNIQLCWQ